MVLRINKTAVLQYLLLYMMMLLNQSVLMDAFGNTGISVAVVVICLAVMFTNKKYYNQNILIALAVFLGLFSFCRIVVGGVGIGIWLLLSRAILITWTAIACSPKDFLDRLVKIVAFFALVSLILFFLSQINLKFVQKMMLFQYKMKTNFMRQYIDSVNFIKIPFDAYGGIIYAVNMTHVNRNCSIFTEPGIYQIVLNTALFILLHMDRYLSFNERKRNRMTIILMIAIITTQSTQGLIVLAVIVAVKYLSSRKIQMNSITVSIIAGIVLLILDMALRGQNSLLVKHVINKMFDSSGLNLSKGTSGARVGTILVCVQSMIQNPIGVGYDRLMVLLNSDVTGYVAASLFCTGAACGILMLAAVLIWFFRPVVKTRMIGSLAKWGFTFMCFATFVYQSNEFYPYLICLVLVFWNERLFSEKTVSGEIDTVQ